MIRYYLQLYLVCRWNLTRSESWISKHLSGGQYESALSECDWILKKYCEDISKTDAWCAGIRKLVEERIAQGEPIKVCRDITNGNI